MFGITTENTSDAAGNWIGSWSQQFAEHEVLCTKTHYGTQGCHSGAPPAMVGILCVGEVGAGPGGPEGETFEEDVGAPKHLARWAPGLSSALTFSLSQ